MKVYIDGNEFTAPAVLIVLEEDEDWLDRDKWNEYFLYYSSKYTADEIDAYAERYLKKGLPK